LNSRKSLDTLRDVREDTVARTSTVLVTVSGVAESREGPADIHRTNAVTSAMAGERISLSAILGGGSRVANALSDTVPIGLHVTPGGRPDTM